MPSIKKKRSLSCVFFSIKEIDLAELKIQFSKSLFAKTALKNNPCSLCFEYPKFCITSGFSNSAKISAPFVGAFPYLDFLISSSVLLTSVKFFGNFTPSHRGSFCHLLFENAKYEVHTI